MRGGDCELPMESSSADSRIPSTDTWEPVAMPSPMNVYREAVRAVPSVKYAMGVAGVVAAGIIAYNLAHEDPKKAILAFVFGLAGMYLLLVFASVRKDSVVVRGPVTLTIWGLTAMFLATLALTLSAYAFGLPEPWARLVGAIPADARVARRRRPW